MFPLFRMESSLEIWRISYCTARYVACARYKLADAGEDVPANLLPSGALLRKSGAPK